MKRILYGTWLTFFSLILFSQLSEAKNLAAVYCGIHGTTITEAIEAVLSDANRNLDIKSISAPVFSKKTGQICVSVFFKEIKNHHTHKNTHERRQTTWVEPVQTDK